MHEITSSPPLPQALDRRKNGIYYSPFEVTRILCNWAIRSYKENILEPSFGGCGFLSASKDRLRQLKCRRPEENLFGCDIDPRAFEYLMNGFAMSAIDGRFLLKDFLQVQPVDFSVNEFDVVIGNPPYVAHQNIPVDQREEIRATLSSGGIQLRFKPSLWAYFVLHSTRFLRRGGRVAWLLPSSFLNTEYAEATRSYLRKHFTRSLVLLLGDRIFLAEGTEERTVVLLCEGWDPAEVGGSLEVGYAADLGAMDSIIQQWQAKSWQGVRYDSRINHALLDGPALASYSELASSLITKPLGDLCRIRIGIVTGANKFFVLNEAKAAAEGISERSMSFILAKFGDAKGVQLKISDLEELKSLGKRCLLVDTSLDERVDGPLKRYLDSFPEEERLSNRTFKKRKLWYQPNDGLTPDAFLSYMQADGPAIVLNFARTTSTNTIHRVYFNRSVPKSLRKAVTVSILSTFSQLSAEIEGRSYGSGVLKHEPSEAYRISLLLPEVSDQIVEAAFNKVDSLLRRGLKGEARAVADGFVLTNYKGIAKRHHVAILSSALKSARAMRQPQPNKSAGYSK